MSTETILLCFCALFLIKAGAWMCWAVFLKWDLDLERELHHRTWLRLAKYENAELLKRFNGAVEAKEKE